MSKEKTLTAEEKLYTAFFKTFHVNPKNIYDVINLRSDDFLDVIDNLIFIEQENAQAKVLEALERVQSDIGEWVPRHMELKEKQFNVKDKEFTKGRIDCMMQISSHIETEVKPKYK